jgi:pyruvate-formate lyase-activating enzyme
MGYEVEAKPKGGDRDPQRGLPPQINMPSLRILLVNPPIYDFTAYDFWLRPYGMFRVAGQIKHACQLEFFDFLVTRKRDNWGRGRYPSQILPRPKPLADIPRRYRRFGAPREQFREFLQTRSFDAVFIQTLMTYWYLGIREVIEDLRELQPSAKIVLGGVYATICAEHARSLGADLVIEKSELAPLWRLLSIEPEPDSPYSPEQNRSVGAIKITQGCPFSCTYCSAPLFWPQFEARPLQECLKELASLLQAGVKNVAFYDDALLFRADRVLIPFLNAAKRLGVSINFHSPNALNARFITQELAKFMVDSGFKAIFLGFESSAARWQQSTGGKISSDEFASAVKYLKEAGADSIGTYIITGHPDVQIQELEESIYFAHKCGTQILLAEFSPIPGTMDGEKCAQWADLNEPLSHNKTAFAIRRLGVDYVSRLKDMKRSLNNSLSQR